MVSEGHMGLWNITDMIYIYQYNIYITIRQIIKMIYIYSILLQNEEI